MFEFTKEDLDKQLTFSTFRDEVAHKTMLIDQYVYEFEKLGHGRTTAPKRIVQFVKLSRKTIEQTENILCGLRTYLADLKIQFFFDLLAKLFRLIIISLNGVSVRLINTIKQRKTTNEAAEHEEQGNFNTLSDQNAKTTSRNNAKKIEYCDFVIKNLEQQEQRLDERKRIMEKQLCSAEGKSLKNIAASDTVNQLENLSRDINKIIANSYRVSSENVITRYQEVSRRMIELTKPEDIKNQFCSQLSSNVKEKFMKTMERIINEMYIQIRRKQRQAIFDQIQAKKPIKADAAIQTDYDAKLKQIEQLIRQKKLITLELQNMKKSNTVFEKQNQKLIQKLKQVKQSLRVHEKRTDEMEQTFRKKQAEFISAREQWEITLKQKKQEIQNLQRRFSEEEMSTLYLQRTDSQVQGINVKHEDPLAQDSNQDKMNASTKSNKYKPYIGQRANNSFLIEKQLQVQKKQNVVLRSSFELLLNKLQQCKLLHSTNAYDLFRELKTGTFSNRIEEILEQMTCNIPIIKSNMDSMSFKQNKLKSSKRIKDEAITKHHGYGYHQISAQTQTCQKDTLDLDDNDNINMIDGKRNSNKLEALKREFLQRVSRKKKSGRYAVRQLTKNNATRDTHDHSDYINKTMISLNTDEGLDQRQSISKPKAQQVNRKDIAFQQFKLMKVVKNEHFGDKKLVSKPKKNILKEKMQQQVACKPIISIESYQVLKEVKAITDMIESKKDGKDYFLTSFIKNLLQEFKKIKGDIYIEDFLRKQLNEIFLKSKARNSVRPAQTKYFNLELNNMR